MLAGDKITLAEMNLRLQRLTKFINTLPPQKVVLTTGQLNVTYLTSTLTYSLELMSTTKNQILPFSQNYVTDLLDI